MVNLWAKRTKSKQVSKSILSCTQAKCIWHAIKPIPKYNTAKSHQNMTMKHNSNNKLSLKNILGN